MGDSQKQTILFLWSVVVIAIVVQAQDNTQPNITGYSCTVGTSPCQTYLFYRAQAPNFLDLGSISDLFETSRLQIQRASNLSSERGALRQGQLVLVPKTCACMGNASQANVTYEIQNGDTFFFISTVKFEHLTTYEAVERANPTAVVTDLQIGSKVIIPIRCKCPTRAQLHRGIRMLLTYVIQDGDTLEAIGKKYGASLRDLRSVNGMPSTINPNTTLLIPVSKKPVLSQPYLHGGLQVERA